MKKHTIFLALFICLGTGLRIYDLGSKSLWLDEAASVYYADVLIPSMVERLANHQYENGQQIMQEWRKSDPSQPPLYYVLLHFGTMMGKGEVAARLLSVLAGVVSIPALYQLTKTLFNERIGLLSALLLAVSPLHVAHSQNARMYTLVTLFVLVSVYCTIRFLKTDGWAWRIGYVLCMVLGLYTHYITVFALILQNVIALIFVWMQRDVRRLPTWLAMQMCVLLLFAPWVPFLLYQMGGVSTGNLGAGQYITLPFRLAVQLFRAFSLAEYRGLPLWITVIGLLGFLIFVIYGVCAPEPGDVDEGKSRKWAIEEVAFCLIYLFFAALGAVLLYGGRPYPVRLALFGLPAYYMLVARGIERIRIDGKAKLAVVVALVALLLFVTVTSVYQRGAQEDWRGVVDYVLGRSQPEDVVVLHAVFVRMPFDYYAGGRISTYVVDPTVFDDPSQAIPAMAQEAMQGHERLWLVLSHTDYLDPDQAVKRHFDEHYSMLEERHFAGVDVFLYEQ